MKKIGLTAGLATMLVAAGASAAVAPDASAHLQCQWYRGEYKVVGVELFGIDGISISRGDSCLVALAALMESEEPPLIANPGALTSPLGQHTYSFVQSAK